MILNQPFLEYLNSLKKQYSLTRKMILIQCPTFSFDAFNLKTAQERGYFAYPPKGLQSLQLVAKECDVDVSILDANFELLRRLSKIKEGEAFDICQLLQEIIDTHLEKHPETLMIGVGPGVNVPNIFQSKHHPYLETLKHLANKNKYLINTGGAIATVERRNLLKLGLAHFVFRGEAECKFRFFLNSLMNNNASQETPGIFFQYNGAIHETSGTPDIVNPNINLIPSYEDIPIEEYHTVGCVSPFSRMLGGNKKYATVNLVRGCRGKCTFCELREFRGDTVNAAAYQTILQEINYLVQQRGVTHLEWLDDDFLGKRRTAIQVLKGIIEAGYPNLTWAENVGIIAGALDREMLDLMTKSGCVGFRIGLETGNREILKKSRKPASMKRFLEVSDLLREYSNLFVVGCYMIGFENETYRQIYQTIGLAQRMNLSWSSISVLQVTTETDIGDETNLSGEWENDPQYDLEKTSAVKLSNPLDYTPSFSRSGKEEEALRAGVTLKGIEVMNLPLDQIHSRDLLPEIWFAFNLIINFVSNKNLMEGGNVDHFIRWVSGLQMSYPNHASMSLFLFLGYVVQREHGLAKIQFNRTLDLLNKSAYWRKRFEQYGLNQMLEHPPKTASSVQEILIAIKKSYHMDHCIPDYEENSV